MIKKSYMLFYYCKIIVTIKTIVNSILVKQYFIGGIYNEKN